MDRTFHSGNRKRLYGKMKENSLLLLFSGMEVRKTNDEYYPFYTDRNFLYLTGLDSREFVLAARKDGEGKVEECVFILPPDPMQERWSGERLKPEQVEALSGLTDIRESGQFAMQMHTWAVSGNYAYLYLDLFRISGKDRDCPAHLLARKVREEYPYLSIENANPLIRSLRTIKQPCEIDAMREAEKITRDGITAMMKASRPGMYEYLYKAEFDYALGQHGPQGPAFPSIISAGRNNFCIHYYQYRGQALDGDMVLNDVGAWHDNLMNDVSRGWPCNGKYTEKQRLLYECALKTSDHMFETIRPGMKMSDVDKTARTYNAEMLREAGVLKRAEDIGTYMWHGGAHHVGYDVHDTVDFTVDKIAPGMVFCVDIGIYHEEWGIGFRLEDNCLVTEEGCENLSAIIPRTIEEIEAAMKKGLMSAPRL